ncbi:hypothetical protein M8494_22440 [Serratia ureilytica]
MNLGAHCRDNEEHVGEP